MKLVIAALTLLLSITCYAQETWCVIGDSLSAPNISTDPTPWPAIIQQNNPSITVVNAAIGGYTFYDANHTATPSLNNYTPVQYCISKNPSKVIVMLGANDSGLTGVPFQGLSYVEQQAQLLFNTLASSLPGVTGYFILEQVTAQNALYPGFTSINFQTIPYLRSDSVQTDYVNSAVQTELNNLYEINNYLISLGIGYAWLNYYDIYVTNAPSSDGLHPTPADASIMAQQIYAVAAP